jgi:hypothetical protein
MPAPAPAPGDTTTIQAALDRLAAALDPADYATTLTTGPGRTSLSVASRHAAIGDDIGADHRAYSTTIRGGMDRPYQRPGNRRPHDQQRAAGHAPP